MAVISANARSGPPAVSGAPTLTPARMSLVACVRGNTWAQARAPAGIADSGKVTPLNATAGPRITEPIPRLILRFAVAAMMSTPTAWLATTNATVPTTSNHAGPRTGIPYQAPNTPSSDRTSTQ